MSIILRNRLKYALTRKESLMIVMQKLVKVDGKVRTELNFPAGFMGASSLARSRYAPRVRVDGCCCCAVLPRRAAAPPPPPGAHARARDCSCPALTRRRPSTTLPAPAPPQTS